MADSDNSTTLPFVTLRGRGEDAEHADKFALSRELRAGEGTAVHDPTRAFGQKDGRRLNDEALVCARDFMASVGRETPRDAANSGASNVSDPAAVARSLHTRFDQGALTVAAWCALLARCDGSDASYQTWKQVFARLHEDTVAG